ncbi:hypothetical protein ABBQ32_006873 [Trebouxia sp. C0010 RCD-2024]
MIEEWTMLKDDVVSTLAFEAERCVDSDANSSTIFTSPRALFSSNPRALFSSDNMIELLASESTRRYASNAKVDTTSPSGMGHSSIVQLHSQ